MPDRPARGLVAIPTTLPRLFEKYLTFNTIINTAIVMIIIIITTTTKVKVKVKFALEQAMKVQKGSSSIGMLFF
jgi:hypothetical protein